MIRLPKKHFEHIPEIRANLQLNCKFARISGIEKVWND